MFLKLLLHIVIIILLTIVTQVGGIIYLISILLIGKRNSQKLIKRLGFFAALYLIATFLIIPNIAPFFGREKIKETQHIKAHSFFYKLANRNYVKPALNKSLDEISIAFEKEHNGIHLVYLDANFPFIDKFHYSHI